MSATRNIRMLTRYNRWANDMVFNAMIQLPSEDVYRKRAAAFGGMIFTLAHVNIVDQIWRSHLLGIEHGFVSRTTETPAPLEELILELRSSEDWFIQYADTMSEDQLDELISFSFVGGGQGQMTRGDIILHVCNHKTLHRGHIGDMFYQSGFKPPSIDLPVFMRDAWIEADLDV
ncbi:MAG: damage-inducible protein DinB [Polynucleobacter sp. 24-46-87]|jgi:uncharacterized damage-inducible protein DinB|nr:MAG: damage-inducible protein DinB [Polynucleobacter sp. 35-46-207]OZA06300.1 MAG: damage-inducible protein DinB [Polynucleobacter sp. 24-46-87]OZB38496.1 MAG: damage-inducible protein DinB [Polynucleobacter sp. 39-45-136]